DGVACALRPADEVGRLLRAQVRVRAEAGLEVELVLVGLDVVRPARREVAEEVVAGNVNARGRRLRAAQVNGRGVDRIPARVPDVAADAVAGPRADEVL